MLGSLESLRLVQDPFPKGVHPLPIYYLISYQIHQYIISMS